MIPVKQSPELEIVTAEDEWIVLNATTCTVTKLNRTGGYILSLLETPHTVDMLVAELQNSFENVDKTAHAEISSYIEQLLSMGIVERVVL